MCKEHYTKDNIMIKNKTGGNETMLDQYEDLMTVQDIQDVLHIGKNRAYELLRDGTISSIRLGKSWEVLKEAVISFLRSWQNGKGSVARWLLSLRLFQLFELYIISM